MENSFTIDQKALSSVLSSMQPICTKRTTLDSTSTVLFLCRQQRINFKKYGSWNKACNIVALLKDSSITEGQSFLVFRKAYFCI